MKIRKIRRYGSVILLSFIWSALGWGATGKISVTVREAGRDTPLPCRVWVQMGETRLFEPESGSCTVYPRDRSFSCDGEFVLELPGSNPIIHIERGKEYLPVDTKIVVHENQTTQVEIILKRWINMTYEGWYSADFHCHFGAKDPQVVKQLALADDVNFEPVLSVWLNKNRDKDRYEWPEDKSIFADRTHLVTFHNEEIERIGGKAFESVGALLISGLNEPVKLTGKSGNYPCDVMLCRAAKQSSPDCIIDTDKPNWGENVAGVALGLFDVAQLCHNHYHRNKNLQMGWGMADFVIEDKWKNADEMFEELGENTLFYLTDAIYYRWLNCGFKLGVTGGSAMGVMPVPLGYNRTYAKLDGPLTEANYLKAVKAGRTFATSGPMLIMTADGKDPGTTIQYKTGESKPIRIEAEVRSIDKLDSLELLHNGKIIKSVDLKNDRPSPTLKRSIDFALEPKRSGWVAARAIYDIESELRRQAHTSPIYIVVDGKPTAHKKDAEYMLCWLDKILEVSNKPGRYNSDSERAEVQSIFKQACQVYQTIAQTAEMVWKD